MAWVCLQLKNRDLNRKLSGVMTPIPALIPQAGPGFYGCQASAAMYGS
jgi:hypothetical protein